MQRLKKMYFICLHLHFFDDDNHDGQKSSTNYAGSLPEAIADTWCEKSPCATSTFQSKETAKWAPYAL